MSKFVQRLLAASACLLVLLVTTPKATLARDTLPDTRSSTAGQANEQKITRGTHVVDAAALSELSSLKIGRRATAVIDFGNTSQVNLTGDLVNKGRLFVGSSNAAVEAAQINASNIVNRHGGLISSVLPSSGLKGFDNATSQLDLLLNAAQNFVNQGTIRSSGSLTLNAGGAIINHAVVSAAQNLNIASAIGSITNTGSFAAIAGNVNVSALTSTLAAQNASQTLSALSNINLSNLRGVISALAGDINVGDPTGQLSANINVLGGDLLSRNLNLYSGDGTANVSAEKVTGTVNTNGTAAHIFADTKNLVLGEQCLTGDPTYYNTGNIVLGGNISVGEKLAIIAGGNITTNQSGLNIQARDNTGQGHDIYIIAGANVSSTSAQSPSPLPSQGPPPSTSGNATASVTISGNSGTGGSIDLSTATAGVTISSASTSTGLSGGDLTLAAYHNAGNRGKVLLPTSNSALDASGNGSGNNGNISVIGGSGAGTAIQLPNLNNGGGTGTAVGTGQITIANAQPETSDGLDITFNINGAITTGNTIVPNNAAGGGSVNVGNMVNRQSISITAGSNATLGDVSGSVSMLQVNSGGDLTLNQMTNTVTRVVATATGDITINQLIRADGGILMVAGGDLISGTGSPAVMADPSGNAGNISLVAGADFSMDANTISILGQSVTGGSILFYQWQPDTKPEGVQQRRQW